MFLYSEMVDILGLPYDVWVVREFLRGEASFTAFRKMPVLREFRFFSGSGNYICHHPYWPRKAIHITKCCKTGAELSRSAWTKRLDRLQRPLSQEDFFFIKNKTCELTKQLGGSWSVDWFYCSERKQWFLTDMALMSMSFHWDGCPNAIK